MTEASHCAAVDLGASSARLFAGHVQDDRLVVAEVARVPNVPVLLPDGLHWDLLHVHQSMLEGLGRLSRQLGGAPLSVGIDGWGVDYGLLDAAGHLLGLPFHYRDARTAGALARVEALAGRGYLYQATGIQSMEINTIFQLLAERQGVAYGAASRLLMVPDLLGFFMTGRQRAELTNASTTQLMDSRTGQWSLPLLQRLGIRADILAPLAGPGEVVGGLLPGVAASVGVEGALRVVTVASHDTASAVLAVPAPDEDFAYVVSGTWSLVGLELERPVIDEASQRANFSNELGVDGTVRFLRNVMGHWMLQECERNWSLAGRRRPTGELLAAAASCPPFRSVVDTGDPVFAGPGDMPARVRAACSATGEPVPQDDVEVARCIVDSMALAVARALDDAQSCARREVGVVHVVGGGVANDLLLQLVASACGLRVVAGPVEASAVGNLLVQLRAAGRLADRWDMRALVARSCAVRQYQPDVRLARLAGPARERLQRLVPASAGGALSLRAQAPGGGGAEP